MQGLHLTADLYQCACRSPLFIDAQVIAQLCRDQTVQAGLTLVDEKWATFPDHDGHPGGVTGMLLLAESHLAIHTWPETGNVTLDVYVCNFSGDNSDKAEQLLRGVASAYMPARMETNRLQRGDINSNQSESSNMALEQLNNESVFGFRVRARSSQRTAHQELEVLDTPQFGCVLRLDGRFMTSEKEEFFYHEALVHPAAIAHPAPRRALILGGGDGGAAEEVLKHPGIERVVLAELDEAVVEAARTHLQAVHRGAFDNPRLTLRIGDGLDFMRRTDERFDLAFMDLTDPDTPAQSLYTREFFGLARGVLAPGGALVLHIGSPIFHPAQVQRMTADLRSVFRTVRCYGLYIPLYGAYWGMAIASDTLDPAALDAAEAGRRLEERGIGDLGYYNAQIHPALFALPNYYRDLVAEGGPAGTR